LIEPRLRNDPDQASFLTGKEYGNSMPKVKTHKGAAKRFKLSGTGKVMRSKNSRYHFRIRKSARVKNMIDKSIVMSEALAPHVRAALPYGLPD